MKLDINPNTVTKQFPIKDLLPLIEKKDIRQEIVNGLDSDKKKISSKHFYDKKGSELFNEITTLPEYYPTRTEKSILRKLSATVADLIKGRDIIDLGSGDHSKITLLFSEIPLHIIESANYIPVDISNSALQQSIESLVSEYPSLNINGYLADFTRQLDLIPYENPRMFCFFGSTIGNFEKDAAFTLLKNISDNMSAGDIFLLGLDMVKDHNILYAAYNDTEKITAEFNKNILNVINDKIQSDFIPSNFDHLAFFNTNFSRIEMHLKAKKPLQITSPFLSNALEIKQDECIHTENSHKYTTSDIEAISKKCKLNLRNTFQDENNWFSLVHFEKE